MYLSNVVVAASSVASGKPSYSLYGDSLISGWTEGSAGAAYVVGLTFYVDVPGYALALKWFKTSGNNSGQHVSTLFSWSGETLSVNGNTFNNGSLLASVSYDPNGESATGWQQAGLPVPVYLSPGINYAVGVNTPTGYHSRVNNYFGTGTYDTRANQSDSGPLHGTFGMNFQTATNNAFPQYQDYTNFCVDLVFQPL